MSDVPIRMVFGNPEMWEQVHKKYPEFFEASFKLNDAMNRLVNPAYDPITKPQRAILNLATLSMISMFELITLVGNGFSQGALKILRSMLEYGINAEFIRLNPAEVEDFIDWYWIEHYKELIYLREHMPAAYAQLTPENIANTEQKYNQVLARFQRPNGRLRDTWSSLNVADRAARTNLIEEYRLIYPLTSRLFHGSVAGMALHYEPDEDQHRLNTPPTLKWSNGALIGGHAMALRMTLTFSQAFNVESNPPYAELEADYKRVWKKPDTHPSAAEEG